MCGAEFFVVGVVGKFWNGANFALGELASGNAELEWVSLILTPIFRENSAVLKITHHTPHKRGNTPLNHSLNQFFPVPSLDAQFQHHSATKGSDRDEPCHFHSGCNFPRVGDFLLNMVVLV